MLVVGVTETVYHTCTFVLMNAHACLAASMNLDDKRIRLMEGKLACSLNDIESVVSPGTYVSRSVPHDIY